MYGEATILDILYLFGQGKVRKRYRYVNFDLSDICGNHV